MEENGLPTMKRGGTGELGIGNEQLDVRGLRCHHGDVRVCVALRAVFGFMGAAGFCDDVRGPFLPSKAVWILAVQTLSTDVLGLHWAGHAHHQSLAGKWAKENWLCPLPEQS